MASSFRPLTALVWRAVMLYVVIRLALAGISLMAAQPMGLAPFPLATIPLSVVLGAIDLRRRGETLLWANLGYPAAVTIGVFGVTAAFAESLLVVLQLFQR